MARGKDSVELNSVMKGEPRMTECQGLGEDRGDAEERKDSNIIRRY